MATQKVATHPECSPNRNVSCGRWLYCSFLICSKLVVAMLPTVQHEFGLLSSTILISFLQGGCTRCNPGRHPRHFVHTAQIIQSRTAHLTFWGPRIVIYSYNKSQRDALISQIYFWNRTLHVSDSFSVHHQEWDQDPDPASKQSA